MNNLTKKVEDISTKLKEKGIVADISFESKWLKKGTFKILTTGVVDDIETLANIQRVLRKTIGYGTTQSKFDEESRTLNIQYSPLEKERFSSSEATGNFSYTPGATEYNK